MTAPTGFNPDGTPNYGSIPSTSTGAAATPVDPTGAIDVWNMPAYLKGKVLWYGTDNSPASQSDVQAQERLKRANTGDGVTVDKLNTPHSFEVQASAEEVMKQFAAMSQNDPMGFAAVQKELQAGAFYGSATSIFGGFNAQTENAIATAMAQYLKVSEGASVPISFLDFLKNTAAANTQINGNGGTAGAGSSTPVLTDPDTLTRYAQMAAKNALGRALTPTEISQFVSEFHNQQIQSYTDAANHNGLSSMKDDPRSSAIGFVTDSNPAEFQTHQAQGYTDAFLNMFLPSGSTAPNVSVDPTAIGY